MASDYQIRVKGHLSTRLSAWFSDFAIAHTADGDTLLTGTLVDQAAVYGLLERCRDLGITLISFHRLAGEQTANQQGESHEPHCD